MIAQYTARYTPTANIQWGTAWHWLQTHSTQWGTHRLQTYSEVQLDTDCKHTVCSEVHTDCKHTVRYSLTLTANTQYAVRYTLTANTQWGTAWDWLQTHSTQWGTHWLQTHSTQWGTVWDADCKHNVYWCVLMCTWDTGYETLTADTSHRVRNSGKHWGRGILSNNVKQNIWRKDAVMEPEHKERTWWSADQRTLVHHPTPTLHL